MEPQISSPNPSPETGGVYQQPELPKAPIEAPTQANPEKAASAEVRTVAQASPPVPQAVTLPQLPTLPAPQLPVAPKDYAGHSANPVIALDEEVIEKEWVDRAKKIVAQTKDDPYTQEKEVSKLQADYLKKRYGKDVKVVDE